jgi:hypothetical protein
MAVTIRSMLSSGIFSLEVYLLLMFQRNVLPPSSESNVKLRKQTSRQSNSRVCQAEDSQLYSFSCNSPHHIIV